MNDSWFKIRTRLAGNIREALKRQSANKSTRTAKLLGADILTVRNYLESKFIPGMNWSNMGRGGWHIDHIIPCRAFDLTNPVEQKQCFHFTNLQPLWEADNIRKSDKVLMQPELFAP